MSAQIFDTPPEYNTQLANIHEGMQVKDSAGQNLGTVKRVYLGAVDQTADERGEGPATTGERPDLRDELGDILWRTFGKVQLPDEFRQRLDRNGFIYVDAHGVPEQNRFILPEQITSVSGQEVMLNLSRADLTKS